MVKLQVYITYLCLIEDYPILNTYVTQLFNESSFKTGLSTLEKCKELLPKPFNLPENLSLLNKVKILFNQAVINAFPTLPKDQYTIDVEVNTKPTMNHDYQCNSAMSLFKTLKANKIADSPNQPRAVGERIMNNFPSHPLYEKLELAGPGYINLYLSKKWVADEVMRILNFGVEPPAAEKLKVIIDYSSPNVAKEMHVGHLRSTIIGDTIARILEFAGHEVERVNHVGDWGTQFGMLIAHLKDTCPNYKTEMPNINDLTKFYKEAKAKFDTDEEFKNRSHIEVVNLQSHDEAVNKENIGLWRRIIEVSQQMFTQVYEKLNVHPGLKMVGESFYNPMLPSVVTDLEKQGMLTNSDGAKICFIEGIETPLIVQKSDGGFGYDTTDLAAIRYRINERKADWVIYVVDSGQGLHFDLVFKAARKSHFVKDNTRLDHVGFGVVQGEDKKRFKTRSGDTVRLVDLLDEARDRARNILDKRIADKTSPLTDEKEIQYAAEQLGYGGVKYFDLRQHRLSDYVFNYDRMLNPEGDTAVYMNYTYARIRSIIRKSEFSKDLEELKKKQIHITHQSEYELCIQLLCFQEIIEQIEKDLLPHKLCNYLYNLSIKLNNFYRDCRVIGSAEEADRILLCSATAEIMKKCLDLLGIIPLERI